jgi:hypothetical protein
MITVRATFDGRVFVPEEAVNLPVGRVVNIPIDGPADDGPARPPLQELLERLSASPANPDWPADGAAQYDHYLYGTPKQRHDLRGHCVPVH